MSRKKLTEYLNDPKLLHTISVEDLKAWAEEVPYAGLIHKLLVQKLILTNAPKEELKRATTLAVLNNANPGLMLNSIEDFKKMMLTEPLDKILDDQISVSTKNEGHGVSDLEQEIPLEEQNSQIDQSSSEVEIVADESLTQFLEDDPHKEENELSDFTSWLTSLKPVRSVINDNTDALELEDKDLASTSLAQLLVEQGHINQAIAMYELLMLKNPQKSSFFAAQIEKLRSL